MPGIHKFGYNGAVGTTPEDIWSQGGAYNWLTAASALRIRAGGDAADTAAGANARKIKLVGLNENGVLATEDVVTAGASASDPTTTTFCRLFRAYVIEVGTYGVANLDVIDIETTGGTLVGHIVAGVSQTQMSMYTVASDKNAYLKRVSITVNTNQSANVVLWKRENYDVVSGAMSPKRLVMEWDGIVSEVISVLEEPILFTPKTDIWMSGAANAGATSISVEYDLTENAASV